MSKGRGKERFKNDAARRALIQAGLDILEQRGVAPGLARVTLKEAIDLSGVPRTTAYRVFAGENGPLELFHNALIAELDEPPSLEATLEFVADLFAQAESIFEAGDPVALADVCREMIRVGFNHRVQVLVDHARWRAYVSSVASLGGTGGVGPLGAPAEAFGEMFGAFGAMFGIRPVPPLTWAGFTELMVAALDGSALRTLADPSFADIERPGASPDPEARWNGAAVLAEALLVVWTEPDPNAHVSADLSHWTRYT